MTHDDELLQVFREEVRAQLEELDGILGGPAAGWDLSRAFHLAHNVKGAGRMIGASAFAETAHAVEDLFGELRGRARVTRPLVSLARDGLALLHTCFEELERGAQPDVSVYTSRVRRALLRGGGSQPERAEREPDAAADPPPDPHADAAPRGGNATMRIGVERLQVVMELGAEVMTGVQRAERRRALAVQLFSTLRALRQRSPALAQDELVRSALSNARDLARELDLDRVRSQQLSERLQGAIRQLRMVRVDTLRGALSRAVQSAAAVAGGAIELRVEGAETELDRAILERLRDPLLHLVRNAVAHGIEDVAARAALGKPPTGAVTLRARTAGPWVEIDIEDDGRGIDPEAVRARAVRDGFMSEMEARSAGAQELLELLFRPGFTTSGAVSELAGRGFGMDIVRTNLSEMGGHVTISSELGRGTRVRMRAPLTLLTIRALGVRAAGQLFAIPMIGIDGALSLRRQSVRVVDAVEVVSVGGALLPVSLLSALLGLGLGDAWETSPAVIVGSGHRRRVLVVDEVVGERELTIQALPWNLRHVAGVAGAAVGDSEEVVLVLDVHELSSGSASSSAGVAAAPTREFRQHRILVVDDSVTSRTLEKNILSSAGYEVLMAVDGRAALELLADVDVDLVITDVDMPTMNGIELTRAIRSNQALAQLPVVLVTSLGADEDRQRGADAGADAYIVKGTFDQDELLRAVARLL